MLEKTDAPVGVASPHEATRPTPGSLKRTRARILAFVNQKGGTGKTTIAQNLAVCLALHHGKQVLCVDLDAQGNFGQGLLPDPIRTTKTADRLLVVPKPNVVEYLVPVRPGVDIIPNHFQRELREAVNRLPLCTDLLRKQLEPVLSRYDFVIIDTPAGLCRSAQIGIDAADEVIIVISCGMYALQGTLAVIEWLKCTCIQLNRRMPSVKILLNNYNERRRFDREFKREIEYIFGESLFQTQIRTSVRIVEAAAKGMAVVEYSEINPGATDFKRLSREVLGLPLSVGTLAGAVVGSAPQQADATLKLVS